jgi:hypothetical protein
MSDITAAWIVLIAGIIVLITLFVISLVMRVRIEQDVRDHVADIGKKVTCKWTFPGDDDGVWSTECGEEFVIIDGEPFDNDWKYCIYCGKTLEVSS